MAVGHWCAYVAGPANGYDCTLLGIVLYNGDGDLSYMRWCGIGKAITRGDWKLDWGVPVFNPPVKWEGMKRKLESMGNGMSSIRWEAGFATTRWDEDAGDELYKMVGHS
jgi:hypothetical protein